MDCENKLLQDEIFLWRYINFILCIGLGSVSYLYINLESRYNQVLHSIVCNTLMHETYSSDDDSDYEPEDDSEEEDESEEEEDESEEEEEESEEEEVIVKNIDLDDNKENNCEVM